MKELIANAYAKINWCLDITGRREDGYHLLDMLMQPVSLSDTLIFRESEALSFHTEGSPVPEGADNLVLRAARKLQPYSGGRGADITLIKRIPSGAGLGGGSADAACTLKALRRFWNLSVTDEQLMDIGLSLGADVPFCLYGRPARVRGIGEILEPVGLPVPAHLLIVKPKDSLSTPAVFRAYDEGTDTMASDISGAVSALQKQDFAALKGRLRNALYPPALRLLPGLSGVIEALTQAGALFAAMSGSGSACFGVFQNKTSAALARTALENKWNSVSIFEVSTLTAEPPQEVSSPLM